MDHSTGSNTHLQMRTDVPSTDVHTRPSSTESQVHDTHLSNQGQTTVVEPPLPSSSRHIHSMPIPQPAHPNLQRSGSNGPRQSFMSVPTLNESPLDDQGSTIGLFPQRHEGRPRYSPPASDHFNLATPGPRVIEPVMLRPPSMRNVRPVSSGYFGVEDRRTNSEERVGVNREVSDEKHLHMAQVGGALLYTR